MKKLRKKHEAVLKVIGENDLRTPEEIAEKLNLKLEEVLDVIKFLIDEGYIYGVAKK